MNINESVYNLRFVHENYSWFSYLNINGYPLIVVVWNILLLAIPFFIVLYLGKYYKSNKLNKPHQKLFAVILGLVWLFFIPNAPYIINDVRHIVSDCLNNDYYRVCAESAWMILFFFTYACVGWVSFVYLLNQMKNFIIVVFSKRLARIFIILIIPVISWGVLLGLINRWNSWEFFIYPIQFIKQALFYFMDFTYFYNWFLYTVFLYILYFVGNMIFKERIK